MSSSSDNDSLSSDDSDNDSLSSDHSDNDSMHSGFHPTRKVRPTHLRMDIEERHPRQSTTARDIEMDGLRGMRLLRLAGRRGPSSSSSSPSKRKRRTTPIHRRVAPEEFKVRKRFITCRDHDQFGQRITTANRPHQVPNSDRKFISRVDLQSVPPDSVEGFLECVRVAVPKGKYSHLSNIVISFPDTPWTRNHLRNAVRILLPFLLQRFPRLETLNFLYTFEDSFLQKFFQDYQKPTSRRIPAAVPFAVCLWDFMNILGFSKYLRSITWARNTIQTYPYNTCMMLVPRYEYGDFSNPPIAALEARDDRASPTELKFMEKEKDFYTPYLPPPTQKDGERETTTHSTDTSLHNLFKNTFYCFPEWLANCGERFQDKALFSLLPAESKLRRAL